MSKRPEDQGPLIKFFRFIPSAREPQRADRSAAGSMPMRAYRYCEAMTTASAFGWYLFPPMTFSLMWDGRMEVLWTYEGADGWFPLKRAQFPNFVDHFNKVGGVTSSASARRTMLMTVGLRSPRSMPLT